MVSESRRPSNPGKRGGGYREGEARATRPPLSGDGMAADAAGNGGVLTFLAFYSGLPLGVAGRARAGGGWRGVKFCTH